LEDKIRVTGDKVFDHEDIFFRFKTASAVNQLSAGRGETGGMLEDLLLQKDDGVQVLFRETPEGIRTVAEYAGIGAGHISKNKIKGTADVFQVSG
jgi:hypothetical protein